MAKKVFNMQGGLHSAAAYAAFENRAYGSCVANAASLVVTAGAGMNLNISSGDGLISVDAFLARRIQVTATETAAVSAANASFNRLDTVVAYIDTGVAPTTAVVDNINDILKFKVVPGTAAATPAVPTGAAIQASIGAGNPYMVLYDVLVPQGATNVAGVTLTDRRKVLTVVDPANIPTGGISTAKIADGAITQPKMASALLSLLGDFTLTEVATPYKWVDGKTIYKKTVSCGGLPNSGSTTTAHGITGLTAVIEYRGVGMNLSGSPKQFIDYQQGNGVNTYIDSTNINIATTIARAQFSTNYMTLWYTK